MMQRLVIAISGVGLLYLGFKVLITGTHFIKGVYSDYANLKTPVGIIFILFGVMLIITSFFKKKA